MTSVISVARYAIEKSWKNSILKENAIVINKVLIRFIFLPTSGKKNLKGIVIMILRMIWRRWSPRLLMTSIKGTRLIGAYPSLWSNKWGNTSHHGYQSKIQYKTNINIHRCIKKKDTHTSLFPSFQEYKIIYEAQCYNI